METLSTASQGDSSVKSDDSSPPNEGGRSSPPPNCAICLGTCKNKSFTDSCLHQFCFKCLLTWSKVKAECPLCKQNFKSIIHNVRSNHQYEQYMVEQAQDDIERIEIDNFTNTTRRFRYRTTLTLPRRDSVAIQQLLLQHYPMMADVLPAPSHRRRPSSYFRRTVYRHNLWARPLPDFTGRFRDCTPEFYRYNISQMHRLMPWLNRELHYLLNENTGHISYVMSQIIDLLPRYHINSPEFREAVQRYFGDRTEHFLHELYCFASTPYDMAGYDRNVQYTTDSRISTMVNEVLSSSDSESSVDSDIVLVSRSMPAEAPPGPSRIPAPVYPQNFISEPAADNVIPIETISQSDSDDDSSEVMVIGYIKPPHARTPEVVDLLGSDSDVVIEDEPQPEPTQTSETQESRPAPLVKLTLTQHNVQPAADSESEGSTYTPPLPRKRPHELIDSSPVSSSVETSQSSSTSSKSINTSYSSTSSSTLSYYSDSSCDLFTPREKKTKKKNTKKSSNNPEKPKKKSKKSKSNTHKNKKIKISSTPDKKVTNNNRKSTSGKGVKSSKRSNSTTNAPPSLDQPSTSGTQTSSKSSKKRKIDMKHSSRESKRLRSVVNVVNRYLRSSSSRESNHTSTSKSSSSTSTSNPEQNGTVLDNVTSASANLSDSSDSEYNLPLNLTVKISQPQK
ncbi:E3 ubiquitin-protein ligase Topors [Zerene cesonia]|uniref:E3 ubiquitin-protein ligase Topors n=1 Tax=Zerene cesonia TaxID=33412 RepID=UPI0018E5353E|nr:E3 ubiquitin-protein ligase Topors [Zerene cesonia]XP_038207932.1 E3 ubiquitin-protein ligase Topors [Zerene cesonia]XP_038207933.1 E3 ubiquitin-protein ligase Topors [Zerene cesonia]